MFKKLPFFGASLLVIIICCASYINAALPLISKAHGKQVQSLVIRQNVASIAPLTILNAQQSDEGLSVEVLNLSVSVVEYFELRVEDNKGIETRRVMLGKNSLSEKMTKHPLYAKTPELRLASGEIRKFQFPRHQGIESSISVRIVLLANGHGWMDGAWLKKLDKPNERGMLWGVDKEETKSKMIGMNAPSNRNKFQRNGFMPTRKQPICYMPEDIVFKECLPPGGDCGVFVMTFNESQFGIQVDFFGHYNCYYPFETSPCNSTNGPQNVGLCNI